jgi:hypothetical protein
MNARELLQSIEARGGVATVKREGGAVKLNVSPRGVALDLAGDIQRFKPALLELLDEGFVDEEVAPVDEAPPETAPEVAAIRRRSISYWAARGVAASSTKPSGGAVEICRVIQSFALLFAAARANRLPVGRVALDGGAFVDEPNITVREIEANQTATARECNATSRELTPGEAVALDECETLLDWLCASWQPDGWESPNDLADEAERRAREVSR